ncbi:erythromycin esterase family protein [Nocardia sp. NPDC051832]|uniref:erythromycin esterase family protein n=1 Tax=Nocardia sp. NPDC051832 TaxID=3155673 RepID=UPI003429F82A
MSTAAALREIGRQLDDPAGVGRAFDELLATRTEPPTLLALGEPTHGIEAFPLLRNELLGQLADRGFRSIVLETDFLAAPIVDDYVNGGPADIDTVLATGFSHSFGAVPGNRELLEWLRAYNAGRAPEDRIRFYGFDAPTEYSSAPSPRHTLAHAVDYLPTALRPESTHNLDTLLGPDSAWTNEAAMFDPAASIGNSGSAHALRVIADDLTSALHRAGPALRRTNPIAYDDARAHARIAQALLRYHAAMATPTPDRIETLLSVRAEMMAENLLTIAAREQRRGPILVFAHNIHLQRSQPALFATDNARPWANAGALVDLALGDRYLFIASDANPHSDHGTLQGALAAATTRRALFPTPALLPALPPTIGPGEPILPGHFPVNPAELTGADAIIFIADTDGKRHQYW